MLFDIESIYSPHVLSLQSLLEESFAHFNDANNYHILNLLSTHASLLEDKYRARMDSIQLPTQVQCTRQVILMRVYIKLTI